MDTLKNSFDDLLSLPLLSADVLSTESVANWSGRLNEWFWSASFWLPEGVTWEDLAPGNGAQYPDSRDIATYPFLLAIIFLFLKKLVIVPFVLAPLAHFFGLRNKKKRKPETVSELEVLYQDFGVKVPLKVLTSTSNDLNWSTMRIEQWLRKKDMSQKRTVYEKFMDMGFLAFYQVCFTTFGILVLYDKPFIWNAELCFEGFPFQEVSTGVWCYYMIGLGYFWFLVLSQIFENRSKEFIIDIIHHSVAILLMWFSWVNNFVRIGSLVLLLHSFSDALLYPGKMFVYSKHNKITDSIFALFVVVWTVTRIVLFPLHVLRNVIAVGFISKSLCVYDVLLSSLFVLHIRWTALIFKMVFNKLCKGEVVDSRSSDEQSDVNEASEANVTSS